MFVYDSSRPVFFLHIPKTAGSSLRSLMRGWFGEEGFHAHYRDGGKLPPRLPEEQLGGNSVVFGHFNAALSFGVQDYYPSARQFCTVMREPFARAVSGYFYTKRRGRAQAGGLESFLLAYPSNPGGVLNYFPFPVVRETYRELIDRHFVAIGTTERLDDFVRGLAHKLGRDMPDSIPTENASPYDEPVPTHLRDAFREKHALEYEVYDYVRSLA